MISASIHLMGATRQLVNTGDHKWVELHDKDNICNVTIHFHNPEELMELIANLTEIQASYEILHHSNA